MSSTVRRRVFGGVVLGSAVLMLILGQTVLAGKLGPALFMFYWLGCLLLTIVAVFVAFADARATAARTIKERRELLDNTLKRIQAEARQRPKPRSHNGGRKCEDQ